jgi:hypothetical protein
MKLNAHTRLLAGPNIAPVGSYKGENESDLKGRQSFRETRENDSIPKETSAAERLLADDTVDGYIPSSEVTRMQRRCSTRYKHSLWVLLPERLLIKEY